MNQKIINQDRDLIAVKTQPLHTFPQIVDGILFGINLFHGETFLGTFDSAREAIDEMARIDACTEEYVWVDGYLGDEADEELYAMLSRPGLQEDIEHMRPDEILDLIVGTVREITDE